MSNVLSKWLEELKLPYHLRKKTLYHQSTTKINFAIGDHAKAHVQFRNRSMTISEVIDYLADHNSWKAAQTKNLPNETASSISD